MFAPKNILVPTDFSKYSDAALKKAVDIAAQYDSKIYLLHVMGCLSSSNNVPLIIASVVKL
jgi:nucleotide-binding universal stress UspA family protein